MDAGAPLTHVAACRNQKKKHEGRRGTATHLLSDVQSGLLSF